MSGLRILIVASLVGGVPAGAEDPNLPEDGLSARVSRLLSPQIGRIDDRLAEVDRELAGLPALLDGPFAERYGFRSETLLEADVPQWVQIDLGRNCRVDRLVVVPAHVPTLGQRGEGYGFPRRFRIEVADNPAMDGSTVVVDRTAEDVPHPGRHPLFFTIDPAEGRFVRFTSLRHFPTEDGFLWALQELLVLEGNAAVGTGRAVTASSSIELFPHWSIHRLNDGQSILGTPVTTTPSPTKGYLSASGTSPYIPKWLVVDLGEEHPLDEIRLVAAEGGDVELLGGRGFPRFMDVQLSNDPAFGEIAWQADGGSGRLLGFPAGCPQIVAVPGVRARYLRLLTEDLWSRADEHYFALAEVQALVRGTNVARGGTVRVSDRVDRPPSSGWAPEFVVDGFGSRYQLASFPSYLDQLAAHVALRREREDLLRRRAGAVERTGDWLRYGTVVAIAGVVLATAWLLARQRTLRRQAVTRLRDQIARDLHDDIGSNLGGIVLLSEMGSRQSGDPRAREDFSTIREAAETTAQSMQDIVWLIQRGGSGLRDLITRMRHSADQLLVHQEVTLTVDPPEYRDRRLSLLFRRHVFLAFKESLNNVRRHADAETVAISLAITSRIFRFEVIDDGCGFEVEQAGGKGHGLGNLQRRARRVGGRCTVTSTPGQGTRITFEARFQS